MTRFHGRDYFGLWITMRIVFPGGLSPIIGWCFIQFAVFRPLGRLGLGSCQFALLLFIPITTLIAFLTLFTALSEAREVRL